jgi:hypothetical protein
MAIAEAQFADEAELQSWAETNISTFLGNCVYLKGFMVRTASGKGGVPEGLAFDFEQREWYLVEYELLRHGVWPHIAEQITRFVVAMQNPASLREIRNRLFEYLITANLATAVARQLQIAPERLLQQVELFIEGVKPTIVIIIDDTNQDLNDFAHALDAPTQIFRVRKFVVNGQAEYYSPDSNLPALQTTPDDQQGADVQAYDVIEILGGGTAVLNLGRLKTYQLTDGRVIHVKKSKYHERSDDYWYGINPSSMDRMVQGGVTHIVFVMGDHGFATVPIHKVQEYLQTAGVTKNTDGSIRHYHVLIANEPDPAMYTSLDTPRVRLGEYFRTFE